MQLPNEFLYYRQATPTICQQQAWIVSRRYLVGPGLQLFSAVDYKNGHISVYETNSVLNPAVFFPCKTSQAKMILVLPD